VISDSGFQRELQVLNLKSEAGILRLVMPIGLWDSSQNQAEGKFQRAEGQESRFQPGCSGLDLESGIWNLKSRIT